MGGLRKQDQREIKKQAFSARPPRNRREERESMPNEPDLTLILTALANGGMSVDEAAGILRFSPFCQTVGGITPDLHRGMRTGFGETVFAQGKGLEKLTAAVAGLSREGATPVLVSRVSPKQGRALLENFPSGEYWRNAGLFSLGRPLNLTPPWPEDGDCVIVTAGACDQAVALEALGTLRFHGCKAALAQDIGIAGLHRVKPWLPALDQAKIIIAIAGMEGALPGVLAGLVKTPVLAVPTSVGYGVSKGGYAALISMLSTCSPGVSVLNIDNGYGAAMFAARVIGKSKGQPGEGAPTGETARPA